MAETRVPPHSIVAERSVLGALLLRPDLVADVVDSVFAGEFYRDAHQAIFEAIVSVWKRGTAVDLVTVREALSAAGKLDACGGVAYITKLVDGVPRSTHATHYAGIVRSKAQLRQAIAASELSIEEAYEEGDEEVGTLLERAENRLRSIADAGAVGGFIDGKELARRTFEAVQRWHEVQDGVSGLATGFPSFDWMTTGLQAGDLIVLAGRPSMGKSQFAFQVAYYVSVYLRKPVAVFSLEMAPEPIGMRLACAFARLDAQRTRQGKLSEIEQRKFGEAMRELEGANIHLHDAMTINITEMRRKSRQLKAQHGLSLVVVDYMQLVDPPETGRRENRTQDVSAISRGLKRLAAELKLPVLALSQLSRRLESRDDKRPIMSDLRESGAIEQDADLIAFMYRDEVYYDKPDNKGLAELIVAKQRNGPVGTVQLHWTDQCVRFDSTTNDHYTEGAA